MNQKHTLAPETHAISLRLGKYDDIFSDFDIRAYSVRALSVDLIDEIKRATTDKKDVAIELVFYLPKHERNEPQELIIKERLAAHFKRHHRLLLKEKRKIRGLGLIMTTLGIIFMIAATYIVFEDPTRNLLLSFLVVFLEPAAWFLLWEGMDQVIFNSRKMNPELKFYRRMSHASAHVHFQTY